MNENILYPSPGLQGKNILLGVTGSIAAYKAAEWVRALVKEEALVNVIMTRAAEQFISSLTFSALTGNTVYCNMFADDPDGVMAHINLPRESDLLLIAPATAQTIARLSNGMADDLLSTAVLAAEKPVVVCPAMNSSMLNHKATQRNLQRLIEYGYHVVTPDAGSLACGEVGDGRLPDWPIVRETVLSVLSPNDLQGQKIVITAGPTREPLDPVRYISNRSSGKMGYALAATAWRRGAEVTLVTGPVNLTAPPGAQVINVTTADEMMAAVEEQAGQATVIVKAAAVADFKPASCQEHKIKKADGIPGIDLTPNVDILKTLGSRRKSGQLLVGFAAESRDHLDEGRRKMRDKNVDLMVINDILGMQTGFDVDTNQVTLVDQSGASTLPLLSKESTANCIWDRVIALRKGV